MRFLCFFIFCFCLPWGMQSKCKILETHKICENVSKLTGEMALSSGIF